MQLRPVRFLAGSLQPAPQDSQKALVLAASPGWASLSFSESEALSVARSLRGAPRIKECRLLLGTQATIPEICQQLTNAGIAHLACQWNAEDPLYSALQLGDGSELSVETVLKEVRMEAGRLVVLAACESLPGRNPGYAGEEFFGLPAAFMFAGAQTVIGSLWLVHDAASALLMHSFYQYLAAGLTPSEALRKASFG